jgi:hypothetical protein
MKYIVKADCYGYKGRYWKEGETVNLADNETPPEHFHNLTTDGPIPAVEEKKLNPGADALGVVNSGLKKGLEPIKEESEPKNPETAEKIEIESPRVAPKKASTKKK